MEIANWMRATEIKLVRDISGNVKREVLRSIKGGVNLKNMV